MSEENRRPIRVRFTDDTAELVAFGAWFGHPTDSAVITRPGRTSVEVFDSIGAARAALAREISSTVTATYIDDPEAEPTVEELGDRELGDDGTEEVAEG